jgi:hypothetical protein
MAGLVAQLTALHLEPAMAVDNPGTGVFLNSGLACAADQNKRKRQIK